VHDKQVRRRRAVLGILVAASLILLTAYFGESPSSPLHQVQRGVVEVLSPVQEGANKVLAPVSDITTWFSDTFRAKSQVKQLRHELQYYEARAAQYKQAAIENQQLSNEVHLDNSIGIDAYHPIAAHVYSRDPVLWYETIDVDKGSADGVHLNDPVIGDRGLVGKVTTVDPTVSVVTLITDHSYAVSAEDQTQNNVGDTGVLVPQTGNPNQLLLQYLDPHAQISAGDMVVTSGFRNGSLDSLYPPGIPIGHVSQFSQNELINSQQVPVDPIVDLRHLTSVQILTRAQPGTQRAQIGTGG
jgi:rod shape-determining protein MreC